MFRRALRAAFRPEVGMSLVGLRGSWGAFVAIWREFSLRVAARRSVGRVRQGQVDVGGFLLLAIGVSALGYGVVMFFGKLLLLVVPEAHGQGVPGGDFFGSADGGTRELLHFLYGLGKGKGFGIGGMLEYFNYGVLMVVGVLIFYHVIFGVVETGRVGEVRFTGWQVLRVVLAVGLIWPLPVSGLGPGQHILLELTEVSGSFAAGVWRRFAVVVVGGGGAAAPVKVPGVHGEFVAKLVYLETCMYIHNQEAIKGGDGAYITVQKFSTPKEVRYAYRDPNPEPRHRSCGTVVVSQEPRFNNPGATMVAKAHREAVRSPELVRGLAVASKFVGDRYIFGNPENGKGLPDVNDWLRSTGLIETYAVAVEGQIGAAAEKASDSLNKEISDSIDKEGWLSAATFFLVIARNQAAFHDAVSASPDVTGGVAHFRGHPLRVVKPWKEVEPVVMKWVTGFELDGGPSRILAGNGGGWWSALTDVVPIEWVTFLSEGNPIESLTSFGHRMIEIAIGLLGVDGLLKGAGFLASFKGPVGKALGSVGEVTGFMTVVGGLLLIAGITLAYVVPLVPFLRFLFGVISWVISVVEALVAIPLFLATQIGGEGTGLSNRMGRQGYLLLLHAVLRPALMILGLVFGYLVFIAAMKLFNGLYGPHLQSLGNTTKLGAVTFVVSLGIYVAVAYAIVNASFKAIDLVPNEVMRWLGGYGRGGEDETGRSVTLVGGGVGRLAGLRGLRRLSR